MKKVLKKVLRSIFYIVVMSVLAFLPDFWLWHIGVSELVITETHLNAGNRTQGGALFTLADLALAAAANSHGTLAFSLSSNITFLRSSGPGDILYAEARERYIGRTTGHYQIDITNQNGELVATFESNIFRKGDALPFTL